MDRSNFLHLSDVVDHRVIVYDGRADYEARVGPAPADKTDEAEKRWTGPAGPYTFVMADPNDPARAIVEQFEMNAEQAAAVNFSGSVAFQRFADFVAKRLATPVNATLSNPIGSHFNMPTELPLGDLAKLFIVTEVEAKALAAELTPPAQAVQINSLTNKAILYGAGETRRVWGIQLSNGNTPYAFDLMEARSNDATNEKHGGVGQPVTISYLNGNPIYTQNLGPEPHNAIMMPTPVQIPEGYAPGFAPQTFGSGTNAELGLVLVAPVPLSTELFEDYVRASLARIEARLTKAVA